MKTKILLPLVVIGLALSALKFPQAAHANVCAYCTNTIVDDLDDGPWPCDEQDQQDASCDPPSANDGPGGDSNPNDLPCDCGLPGSAPSDSDCGAPVWRVSEPYCTLWLRDTPLLYRKSNGKWMRLELRYKHRGEILTNGIGSFGPRWYCSWLGVMENDGSSRYTNHLAGGGTAYYDGSGLSAPEYRYGTILVPGAVTPVIINPSGAQNQYGFCSSLRPGICDYFRTQLQDRYLRTTFFNFEVTAQNWVRVTNVVDTDGLKCVLTYNGQNLVSTVTDPYGRTAHFYYDALGQLTNIVDTMGMSSTFEYGTSNVITRMTTPYGPTSFEYFPDTNSILRRAVRITEASGDQQLYAYCASDIEGVAGGGDNNWVRNSFHWNRAQYQAVSGAGKANPLDMPAADYLLAETSHWLIGVDDNNYGLLPVSDTLNARAPPADANGYRNIEWFQYQDQSTSQIGTLKRVTEHFTPTAQTVEITRNYLGRPTSVTYLNSDGKTALYTNTFDQTGRNLLKIVGPQGELVRGYGYHAAISNLLVSVTNALGEVTRYTHDGNTNTLRVTNIVFASGLVRTNFYTNGFLVQSVDVGFRTNSFTYENGNVKTKTDELGLTVTNSYDALNRLTNIAFPDRTSIAYLYDKLDVVGVKDRLGNWTRYQYNSIRQLTAVTNANGQVTEYAYCGCGSPTSITRWNGTTPLIDQFTYDMAGHLTNATYADGYQLSYTYNANDLVETVTDNTGLSLVLNYIQIGRIYKIGTASLDSGPYGWQVLANSYDGYGRLQASVDRNGITVTNAYDFLDRVVTRVTLDMNNQPYATNTFAYTARGLTNSADPLGNATWYVLDAAGRLLSQTNANNEVLQFTYNGADQIVSLTDGKGQVTRWNINQYGQITDKVDQASVEVQRFVYDPNGRITNRWSAAMGTNSYTFDPIGNLTNIIYPGNIPVSYAYDGLNRLTNMVDAVGTTKFNYTASGQLLTEESPFANSTTTNIYWSRMRTNLSLQQPSGLWTNAFGYSPLHRLNSVTSPAGTFAYNYAEPSDRLTSLALPTGAWISNPGYDALSRLTDSQFYDAFSTLVDRHSYLYDLLDQRTNETRVDGSTVNYFYDNIGQLKIADSSLDAEDRGYFYDAAWNLNRRTNNGVTSSFFRQCPQPGDQRAQPDWGRHLRSEWQHPDQSRRSVALLL